MHQRLGMCVRIPVYIYMVRKLTKSIKGERLITYTLMQIPFFFLSYLNSTFKQNLGGFHLTKLAWYLYICTILHFFFVSWME